MIRPLVASAALLVAVAGCASTAAEPEPTATADAGGDACVYLAGGALDDAVDFAHDYSTDRESAELADVQSIIERFETAESSASTGVRIPLQTVLREFRAIETRLDGGDPLTPVAYEVIVSSLDAVFNECREELS